VCRECKQELTANWFSIERQNLSGRRSYCRLGFDADTGLWLHMFLSPHILPSAHLALTQHTTPCKTHADREFATMC
jgi:hypothetical protein